MDMGSDDRGTEPSTGRGEAGPEAGGATRGATQGGPWRRVAVFDPFAGVSGDMVLGAWVDLGLDPGWIRDVADALGLPAPDVSVERVRRAGLSAPRVVLDPAGSGGPSGADRSWASIRRRIEESRLSDPVKSSALGAFGRLASAEGRVHGIAPEEVHFHEVGALDSILDVCGGAAGFHRLEIAEAATHPVTLGRGSVPVEHGRYPVPAPATAHLLQGIATRSPGYDGECTTPTGAALLVELTGGRRAEGDLVPERIGYGAGRRDPEDRPNCLRVWLGRTGGGAGEAIRVLQADIDDMSPEYVPDLIDACLDAGALDAVVRGVQMKKGRPGWRIEALTRLSRRADVEAAIFRHSTTLGIRSWPATRHVLPREGEERSWRGHPIRLKRARRDGSARGGGTRIKPEHDDVAAAAAAEGMDVPDVLRELRDAWPEID